MFAPFIVLYLIMYSFFRYFDVRLSVYTVIGLTPVLTPYPAFAFYRSIIRTPPLSAVESIPRSRNGSSGSSTNCRTTLLVDLTNHTPPLLCISANFRTRS